MATRDDIQLRQLEAALAQLGRARLANPVALDSGKAFELWLMVRMAAHWQRRGWRIQMRDVAGNAIRPGGRFISRGSPGQIGRTTEPTRAGYIFVDMAPMAPAPIANKQLELHGSLQFIGRSDALHECDISMIPHDLGEAIRNRPTGGKAMGAPVGIPPIAIECKRHTSDGSVGETREAVARLFDLSRIPTCAPTGVGQIFWPLTGPSVGWGRRFHPYRSQFRFGYYAIARRNGFHDGAVQMSYFYHLHGWAKMSGNRALDLANTLHAYLRGLTWTKIV